VIQLLRALEPVPQHLSEEAQHLDLILMEVMMMRSGYPYDVIRRMPLWEAELRMEVMGALNAGP